MKAVKSENLRTQWFEDHIDVSSRAADPDAVPLTDAVALARPSEVVESLARLLRRIHATPVEECPFVSSPEMSLTAAREDLESGAFDSRVFEGPYSQHGGARLVEIATTFLPHDYVPSVIHGSLRLSSLVVVDGETHVAMSAPSCGVGDAYQDVVYLAVDIAAAVGLAAAPALFDEYGIDSPELARVEYWTLIDQLRDRGTH